MEFVRRRRRPLSCGGATYIGPLGRYNSTHAEAVASVDDDSGARAEDMQCPQTSTLARTYCPRVYGRSAGCLIK
jgi:hypothetical protein